MACPVLGKRVKEQGLQPGPAAGPRAHPWVPGSLPPAALRGIGGGLLPQEPGEGEVIVGWRAEASRRWSEGDSRALALLVPKTVFVLEKELQL